MFMKNLQKAFQVEDSKISSGTIRFCGGEIKQHEDFSIVVTCKDTTERLEKISYRTGVKKETPVTERERSQLRSVVGELARVAGKQDWICLTKCLSCSHDAATRP